MKYRKKIFPVLAPYLLRCYLSAVFKPFPQILSVFQRNIPFLCLVAPEVPRHYRISLIPEAQPLLLGLIFSLDRKNLFNLLPKFLCQPIPITTLLISALIPIRVQEQISCTRCAVRLLEDSYLQLVHACSACFLIKQACIYL